MAPKAKGKTRTKKPSRTFYCGGKDKLPRGKKTFGTREQCQERPSQIRRFGIKLLEEQLKPKRAPRKKQEPKGKPIPFVSKIKKT